MPISYSVIISTSVFHFTQQLHHLMLHLQNNTTKYGNTAITNTEIVNGVIFNLTYQSNVLTLTSVNCDFKVMYDTNLPLKKVTVLASSASAAGTTLCGVCPSG